MSDYTWDQALDELEGLLDELDGAGEESAPEFGDDGDAQGVPSLPAPPTDEERDRAAALLARSMASQQRLVQVLEQAFRRFAD